MSPENWIGEMPATVRDAVEARMVPFELRAGAVAKNAGDPPEAMYQLDEGYLRLLGLHPDGRQVLIQIYGPGNCFGETCIVAHRPYNHSTIALTGARGRKLSESHFWELYHRYPEISEALCRKFANNISRQFAVRELRATNRLRKLVALMFENLSEHCGKRDIDGVIRISIPITQTDIAEHLDVTRQGVQREIGALKLAGILTKQMGIWRICDLERLRRL